MVSIVNYIIESQSWEKPKNMLAVNTSNDRRSIPFEGFREKMTKYKNYSNSDRQGSKISYPKAMNNQFKNN